MKTKGIKVLTASDDVKHPVDHKNFCFFPAQGYKAGDKAKNTSASADHHNGSPKGPVSLLCPPHPHISFYFCVQTSDKTILYSVASALVNCTNSYDTKELVPELVQLAKFSKQHVPEEHPKVGCL